MMLELSVVGVLVLAVIAAVTVPPAAVCTDRMLVAAGLLGMPGSMAAVLGLLIGTPLGIGLALLGGLGASAALSALRAPVPDDEPDTGPGDNGNGGGPGPDPDDGDDPSGGGVDWDAFERAAHAAFEAHRAGRGPSRPGASGRR